MSEPSIERIALHLRERRQELGMTQEDLAATLGVTQAYLSNLETGGAATQLRRLVLALNAVGLDLVAVPRNHPVALEERMRPVHSRHRRTDKPTQRLRVALSNVDPSRVADPELAGTLRALREVAAGPDDAFEKNPRVRRWVVSLRNLAAHEDVMRVADNHLRAVLTAVREAYPESPDHTRTE